MKFAAIWVSLLVLVGCAAVGPRGDAPELEQLPIVGICAQELPPWYEPTVRDTALLLGARLPLGEDLIITFDAPVFLWGGTQWDPDLDAFHIELSPWITSEEFLRDVIMHEYAHCMAWSNVTAGKSCHGPAWGVALAECYRVIVEDEGALQSPFTFFR